MRHYIFYGIDATLLFLQNSTSRDLLGSIIYSMSVYLVWKDLKEKFDKVNRSRIYQWHREKIVVATQGLDYVSTFFHQTEIVIGRV